MTQEHIPGPRACGFCECVTHLQPEGVCLSCYIKGRVSAVAPDPECTPSKPGAEAAAPVPLPPDLLVVWRDNGEALITTRKRPDTLAAAGDVCWPKGISGYYLASHCRPAIFHPSAMEALTASLRESVASLTRERDEALIALGKAAFEIKALEAERDAMRLALETWKRAEVLRDKFDEAPADDAMEAAEEVQSLYDEACALRNAALIDARNSTKEAQNG